MIKIHTVSHARKACATARHARAHRSIAVAAQRAAGGFGRFLLLMGWNVGLIGRRVFVWFFRAGASLLSRPGDKRTASLLGLIAQAAMLGTESPIRGGAR
jgi:hypothetical protein